MEKTYMFVTSSNWRNYHPLTITLANGKRVQNRVLLTCFHHRGTQGHENLNHVNDIYLFMPLRE